MKKLLLITAVGSLVGIMAVLAAAYVLTASFTTEVLFVTPNAPEAVEMEKMMWEEGDPVAPIYGIPANDKQRILFADESKIIRPEEDPELVLYIVSKTEGDNPLQEKTIWFFARYAVLAFGLLGFLSAAGLVVLKRRR